MATNAENPTGHAIIERSTTLLFVLTLLVVLIGGLVEIVPLFKLETTVQPVPGMRPYSPLEQIGRNVYTREGCYTCHSQQIRPFRDEVERYGHYSLAAESMYDRPFQWGSKRTGPDLARVGGKYSDEWHVRHLIDPRSVVPESIMPGYPFLFETPLDYANVERELRVNAVLGVPYTDEMIANARIDVEAQGRNDDPAVDALLERYPKAQARSFSGRTDGAITEGDALVAYLQMLGTLVDFTRYDNQANIR